MSLAFKEKGKPTESFIFVFLFQVAAATIAEYPSTLT